MPEDITNPDNLPVTDPQDTTEVPEAEQIPAWAVELRKSNETAIESMKVAQGQARRAEQRADALQDTVSRLLANQQAVHPNQPQKDAIDDVLAGLDSNDPATRAVVKALQTLRDDNRQLRAEVAKFNGHLQHQQISEYQAGRIRYSVGELQEAAELAGVDFKAILPQLDGLDNADAVWAKGKQLIKDMKKAAASDPKAHADALRQAGKYGEKRDGGGTALRGRENLTAAQVEAMTPEQVAALNLTNKELAKLLNE